MPHKHATYYINLIILIQYSKKIYSNLSLSLVDNKKYLVVLGTVSEMLQAIKAHKFLNINFYNLTTYQVRPSAVDVITRQLQRREIF